MIAILTLAAATSVAPLVSTAWLQAHLNESNVRVIFAGEPANYRRGHIAGARSLDHMDTVDSGHHLLPPDALARRLAMAGAEDGAQIVLYGDSPMATGWIYIALASIGHGDDVSLLDGGTTLWTAEGRPLSTTEGSAGSGRLTVRAAPDVIVDRAWVRGHLQSPSIRLLDVRTTDEWKKGHLPGATLVQWQDLLADQRTLRFKSIDEIRALLAAAGVAGNQEVVTYCAIGMRASLMYWAAHAAGIPARVYVGSYQDWVRDSTSPIVR